MKKYCVAADIGGTTVKLGLFTAEGELTEKWEIPTRTHDEGVQILPDVADAVKRKLSELHIPQEAVQGIGVGVPAPVTAQGVVNGSANLGWKYKHVANELAELVGLPVKVGNDANVAALGEMWKGGGRGEKDMVMITLGTGVGGGIISDGRILTGVGGAGGEIGHLGVNRQETRHCGCGKCGCLEQYASATGIARLAREYAAAHPERTSLSLLPSESITAKEVFDALKKGDAGAQEIVRTFGDYLGYGLSLMATLIDPAVIVIGGGVSKAGEILLDYVQEPFERYAFFANKNVRFTLATLGNDAGIWGAARLILDFVGNE